MRKCYPILALLCLFGATAQAQLSIFADDYGTGIVFAPFGGSVNNLTIDATTFYSGTKSLKAEVPAGGYTGGALVITPNANVSTYNAVTFWVKASKAVTLDKAGLGNNAASDVYASELLNISVNTSWVKVILPIPNASKLTAINGLWHFAEGSGEGAYTLWFDDIQYENIGGGLIGAPGVTMDNQNLTKAIGGTLTGVNVRATYPINAVPRQVTVAPAYLTYTSNPVGRITFDAMGVGTAANPGIATVTATLGAAPVTGTISVTVSGAANAPNVAAPTPPVRNAGDVISVFSNAYTNIGGVNFNPGWGQPTVQSEVQVAGNATLKYENLSYQGFEIDPGINLTGKTKLHFDIWSPDCTEFKFFLISLSPTVDNKFVTVTPTLSGWQQVDVLLSPTYNGVVLSNVRQMKIEGLPNTGARNTVYLDNIYFYTDAPLPVKLTSFTATRKNNSVELLWATATETNNKGFGIERSKDGQQWSEINFVKASSSASAGSQYNAADATPYKGMNYYRLKQVDFDGKANYSAVKAVNIGDIAGGILMYPNPAKGRVNLYAPELKTKTMYSLVNVDGKVLKTGVVATNNSVLSIDISTLPAGTYLMKFTGEGVNSSSKLVVY